MDASEMCRFIRDRFGIRIENSSAAYLIHKFQEQPNVAVPVMGGDARTGIAVRKFVVLDDASHPQRGAAGRL